MKHILAAAVLCMLMQVQPGNYINLNAPDPLGDVSFYTNCPFGDGPLLGERMATCWDRSAGVMDRRLTVNVQYDNIQDALAGRPMAGIRDWWWYVKFSNGRLCGGGGWTWN